MESAVLLREQQEPNETVWLESKELDEFGDLINTVKQFEYEQANHQNDSEKYDSDSEDLESINIDNKKFPGLVKQSNREKKEKHSAVYSNKKSTNLLLWNSFKLNSSKRKRIKEAIVHDKNNKFCISMKKAANFNHKGKPKEITREQK